LKKNYKTTTAQKYGKDSGVDERKHCSGTQQFVMEKDDNKNQL